SHLYTPPLHDALPISAITIATAQIAAIADALMLRAILQSSLWRGFTRVEAGGSVGRAGDDCHTSQRARADRDQQHVEFACTSVRSEEHTSELQSRENL